MRHYSFALTLGDEAPGIGHNVTVKDGTLRVNSREVYPNELQLIVALTVALEHWRKGRHEKLEELTNAK